MDKSEKLKTAVVKHCYSNSTVITRALVKFLFV